VPSLLLCEIQQIESFLPDVGNSGFRVKIRKYSSRSPFSWGRGTCFLIFPGMTAFWGTPVSGKYTQQIESFLLNTGMTAFLGTPLYCFF
jgi:hypothetical protein